LGFQGHVRLKDPAQTYAVLIEHPVINAHNNDVTVSGGESLETIYAIAKQKAARPVYTEEELAVPRRVLFGRRLCGSGRGAVSLLNLSKRKYLGKDYLCGANALDNCCMTEYRHVVGFCHTATTSMDHELSLIMANMACVRRGSMVLDPFVGSGSILVACAHYGGFCVGTDIDVRALRNKQKGNNIFASFEQYGFDLPEVLRYGNIPCRTRPTIA
jgi:tRNA G10  N-methylase Trm11